MTTPAHEHDSVAVVDTMLTLLGVHAEVRAVSGPFGSSVWSWRHGALHDPTPAMREHVVMTFRGPTRRVARTSEGCVRRGWIRPGVVTTIPSGDVSHWDIEGPVEAVNLYIPQQSFSAVAENVGPANHATLAPLTVADDPYAAQLILALDEAVGVDDMLAEQLMLTLVARLTRTPSPPEFRRTVLAPWQIKRACSVMTADLSQPLSLQVVAAEVGLSPSHFARGFKAATGLPPHQWRLVKRMERVADLLAHTALSVTEVAAAVGYEDPSSFAAVFRRRYGHSPSTFRTARS